jgi:hypothetical protein
MSIANIRNALERALDGMTPALHTVHENEAYAPVAGVPYQEAYVLRAPPDNPTLGDGYSQERGLFFIKLKYALQAGSGIAEARAELVRALFHRGASFVASGTTVQIERTAEIATGMVDGDRWSVAVKVRWFADVFP